MKIQRSGSTANITVDLIPYTTTKGVTTMGPSADTLSQLDAMAVDRCVARMAINTYVIWDRRA